MKKQRKIRLHAESLEKSGRRFVDAWHRQSVPRSTGLRESRRPLDDVVDEARASAPSATLTLAIRS
jgi:hypothetical protein